MRQLIDEYRDAGIERIVALRGDMPSGVGGSFEMVYANELVAFIREHYGDHFQLEVAAYPEIHPQAKSYTEDIRYLKGKRSEEHTSELQSRGHLVGRLLLAK